MEEGQLNYPEEELKKRSFSAKTEKVNERDIYKLAIGILVSCGIIFVTIASFKVFADTKGVNDVWEFSKVLLNSIISLVLGLYFGTKKDK